MNRTNKLRQRLRKRLGARGAAMVEGIVIMSGMVCFIGLIVWTRKAYGMKLDFQQRTRSDSLYFASHGCEGQGGLATPGGGGTMGGSNPAAAAANAANQPGSATVNQSWNQATAKLEGQALWAASFNANPVGAITYVKTPMVANVKAESTTVCNEKKYNSQLTAWFKFGLDLVKGGGGFMNLFN